MSTNFGQSRWGVVRGKKVKKLAVPAIDITELRIADANGILQ